MNFVGKGRAYLKGWAVVAILIGWSLWACKKNPCKDMNCQNGGSCVEGRCNCALPWEGSRCEVDARAKFFGNWRGPEDCGRGNFIITYNLIAAADGGFTITDSLLEIQYKGYLKSSTALEIPWQQVENRRVSGRGELRGDSLLLWHAYAYASGDTVRCQARLARVPR
ncbi:MAG: calcium-binding EGF-like domain-containing protein [Bacteroidia bacterium]|nr:calcium-binding EGF-like domain-containing protein [Bacteroidia bacterium]MDW8088311.1 calcium-binding EGF-like domain-containing protein [Bacteroidia bacterium]